LDNLEENMLRSKQNVQSFSSRKCKLQPGFFSLFYITPNQPS
jgi:hypothetical protein